MAQAVHETGQAVGGFDALKGIACPSVFILVNPLQTNEWDPPSKRMEIYVLGVRTAACQLCAVKGVAVIPWPFLSACKHDVQV